MRTRFLGLVLFAASLLAGAPLAHADSNTVQFFNNVHVEAGKPAENVVCFFCSVQADGEVNGNIVSFFSNVQVRTTVHQNVVSFFSDVTALPNASIEQNSVNIFSALHVRDNAHIGQNVVAMFGSTEIASSAVVDGNRVLFPFWIFGIPAVLLGFLIYAIVHWVRERRYAAYYPVPPRV